MTIFCVCSFKCLSTTNMYCRTGCPNFTSSVEHDHQLFMQFCTQSSSRVSGSDNIKLPLKNTNLEASKTNNCLESISTRTRNDHKPKNTPEERIHLESALHLFFLLSFSSTAETGRHTDFTSVWSSGVFCRSPPSPQDKCKLQKTHSCRGAKQFAGSPALLLPFHAYTLNHSVVRRWLKRPLKESHLADMQGEENICHGFATVTSTCNIAMWHDACANPNLRFETWKKKITLSTSIKCQTYKQEPFLCFPFHWLFLIENFNQRHYFWSM